MEQITVKMKNEVFLQVVTEPGIEMELSEHFCFFVEGYKFMPAYKNRMWDGKIRLYDARKKEIYGGLFKYIQEFAQVRDYELIVEDNSMYGRPDTTELHDIETFLDTLSLSVNGVGITPRSYQLEALERALQHKKALLLSPTASGKSLIIYLAIRYHLEFNQGNVLLIVPTTSLVEQMYSDFADYSQLDEWNVEDNCHKIYSGKEKYNIKQQVVITTWQSIYKESSNWFQPYGMIVGDEAGRVANVFKQMMRQDLDSLS